MPLVRRLPKRGFRHVRKHAFAVLNLRDLAAFVEGEVVSPETLKEKGLVFVGLDVIGDYVTEINVTSPTCIRELDAQFNLDIAGELIRRLEQGRG